MRRAVASGKDSWHNRWSDCQTLYQYQLHYLKNKKNKFKVRRQFEKRKQNFKCQASKWNMPHKYFQPSFPKTLAWLNSSLLYGCSALSSAITIVSECCQIGFCFHVSFFITLPFPKLQRFNSSSNWLTCNTDSSCSSTNEFSSRINILYLRTCLKTSAGHR